jgi:uncharacterized SAM-binding protein YcdF (DUF218 family)
MLLCTLMRKLRIGLSLLGVLAVFFLGSSGSFLIVNDPQPADLIIVLAGETDRRPARGLQLLRQYSAPRMLLDVPSGANVFDQSMIDIANRYIQQLPDRDRISVCPIFRLSTKAEAHDLANCLGNLRAERILVVTSDYHTRRALSIFKHELPGHQFSVAAASDPSQYGSPWWKHRQWAKTNLDECLKFIWWEAVDRWRS